MYKLIIALPLVYTAPNLNGGQYLDPEELVKFGLQPASILEKHVAQKYQTNNKLGDLRSSHSVAAVQTVNSVDASMCGAPPVLGFDEDGQDVDLNGEFICDNYSCTLECDEGYGWHGNGTYNKKIICDSSGMWKSTKGTSFVPSCSNICGYPSETKYFPKDHNGKVQTGFAFYECKTMGGLTCTPGQDCPDSSECYIRCVENHALEPTPKSNTITCSCSGKKCRWRGQGNVATSIANTATCQPHNNKRIIGGSIGRYGADSAMAISLGYYASNQYGKKEWVHFCGGVLLTSKWAFTAAHCRMARLRALLGEFELNKRDGSEVQCRVIQQSRHPDYDSKTHNDIMMIQLRCRRLEMGVYIHPAILPRENTQAQDNIPCRICGWGNTRYPVYVPAKTLMCVTLPIMNTNKCNINYIGAIHEDIFCIGDGKDGKDSCQGDSGGPAVCNGITVGIVMGGLYCAKAEYPGVYTKVSHYIGWAKKVIRSSSSRSRRSKRHTYAGKVNRIEHVRR